jgi:hypothetical protein
MAVNPNTTNLAVEKQLADQIRAIAKEVGLTTLKVTNQMLAFVLKQNEIDKRGFLLGWLVVPGPASPRNQAPAE